jgi:hypothetical protein
MPRYTARTSIVALVVLGGLATLLLDASAQQSKSVPDLSSTLAGWVAIDQDYQPVEGFVGPVVNDPAYPYYNNGYARRAGKQPTYRIADLTNPNVKPWAKEVMKRENDRVLAGAMAYTPRSSCMPSGVPSFVVYPVAEPLYFLQTPRQVTIIFSGNAEVRRVYLDVRHSANPKPSWYGESVGRYDGDTLVIDTIGISTKASVDLYRTPHTEKLHVVERWRLVDDMKLQVVFEVDDPDTFYQPWKASYSYRKIERPVTYEEVCAENNQQLFNYHIPVAGKADF